MFDPTPVAYAYGERTALGAFGLTKIALSMGAIGKGVATGAKWLGRGASVVPVVGNAAGAVLSGAGGAIQGFAQGEGLKGAVTRGGIQAASSLIPGGGGIVAGMAGDVAADKLLAPKPAPTGMTNFKRPAGPGPSHMPGAAGQGNLPGMVHY